MTLLVWVTVLLVSPQPDSGRGADLLGYGAWLYSRTTSASCMCAGGVGLAGS